MRYLIIISIFFSSHFVFADSIPPICSSYVTSTGCSPSISDAQQFCGTFCIGGCAIAVPAPPSGCDSGRANFDCMKNCSCPTGYKLNSVMNGSGVYITECIPDVTTETPPDCPSGYPKINGQCAICVTGYNADGSCVGSSCPAGQITQGYINGQAVCQGVCADPNQYWGFVNGVEGCYGSPSCPNAGSFGYVNGVGGCYGSASSTDTNTSSGSGASAGSNTSTGSGGGASAGANTSSGTGTGTGSGSGSGSGSGTIPSNNSIGQQFPLDTVCPDEFYKNGDFCVSQGAGDCITGYHELVVSTNPFLFVCVADDEPPLQFPTSSPSSFPSSQQNSSVNNSQANASSGTTTSSGSGSGSGSGSDSGGSGSEGETSGECDSSSSDYLSCISGTTSSQITDLKLAPYSANMAARLQQSKTKYTQTIQNIKTQFESELSLNLGGSSSALPSQQITLYGQTFEAGIAARSDFFELIRWAFFAAASILALYILLSR